MTYPRRNLVVPGHAGAFHVITRCVRRAWLCGVDPLSLKDYEYRKPIVEQRILQLGNIFAVGIYGYAVMSNHLHIQLNLVPSVVLDWSDEEVARRWLSLYPPKPENYAARHAEICADAPWLLILRDRLKSLSWFMKSLNEWIARIANAEDNCTGRFWEGRFTCQALLNEKAMLAAAVYVDLNPIRAKMAKSVTGSKHTGVFLRAKGLRKEPTLAEQVMLPLAGVVSTLFPTITTADYIALVDWTGRQFHPGKRGVIDAKEPPALRKLGLDSEHWTMQVKSIGSGYWRVVGEVEDFIAKAEQMKQHWLCGIGLARLLKV